MLLGPELIERAGKDATAHFPFRASTPAAPLVRDRGDDIEGLLPGTLHSEELPVRPGTAPVPANMGDGALKSRVRHRMPTQIS